MATRPKKVPTQTVTFVADCEVYDHNNALEQSFKAGEVCELSPASARRWISRGKALAGEQAIDATTDAPDDATTDDSDAGK